MRESKVLNILRKVLEKRKDIIPDISEECNSNEFEIISNWVLYGGSLNVPDKFSPSPNNVTEKRGQLVIDCTNCEGPMDAKNKVCLACIQNSARIFMKGIINKKPKSIDDYDEGVYLHRKTKLDRAEGVEIKCVECDSKNPRIMEEREHSQAWLVDKIRKS